MGAYMARDRRIYVKTYRTLHPLLEGGLRGVENAAAPSSTIVLAVRGYWGNSKNSIREAGVATVDSDRYEALGGWWRFLVKLRKDVSEAAAMLLRSGVFDVQPFRRVSTGLLSAL